MGVGKWERAWSEGTKRVAVESGVVRVDGSVAERRLAQRRKSPAVSRAETMFSRSCSCGGRDGGGGDEGFGGWMVE